MRKAMKWMIVVLTMGFALGAQAVELFSDGFESGNFTAGGWIKTSSPGITTSANTGTKGVLFNGTDMLTKAISTVGTTGPLTLSYAGRNHPNMDAGEGLIVEWSPDGGTTWNPLGLLDQSVTSYVVVTTNLPAGAENNPNFQFRFSETGNLAGETAYLDDVVLSDSAAGVNPPVFTSDPVVEANAEATVAYSSTIADNATDADNDPLTFTVSPTNTWLTVAESGALSGTPGTNDVGLNSWTVQVSDGTFSTNATLQITVDAYVNRAPVFAADPFSTSSAAEGAAYNDSIAGFASDEESDPMTFSLVSPTNSWLSVSADGSLIGTPGTNDVGLNSFTVQVAATGGVDTATLNINVGYSGPRVTLFSDGFESTNFTAGGWTMTGNAILQPLVGVGGTVAANIRKVSTITKVISTVGKTRLTLSYDRKGVGALDASDFFYVDWSTDGSTWIALETIAGKEAAWVSKSWSLPPGAENQAGFRFRFRMVSADGKLNEYYLLDNVLVTVAAPEGGVYTPFPPVADPVNLIANGQLSELDTQLPDAGQAGYNVLGSFGDFWAYTGKTANVTGWAPYYADPSNLVAMVGTPHVINGVGLLDGTFYLDTTANGSSMTLNSSASYRNGMKQEDILNGTSINAAAAYELSIQASRGSAGTVQDNATLTFALTAGADATNTANAVSGALLQISAADAAVVGGTNVVMEVSGSALATAQSGGPVNVIFDHINATVMTGLAAGTPVNNEGSSTSQLKIQGVSLLLVIPENDLNKDGVFDQADVDLAQLYLNGDGGPTAAVRQDAWIAIGLTPAEALAQLNLTAFDTDGDGYFDAADVTTLTALLFGPQDVVVQLASSGSGMDIVWSSNLGKTYDLESSTSLVFTNWSAYNDGVTTYTNIAATVPTNTLNNVQIDAGPRFFRIIEK